LGGYELITLSLSQIPRHKHNGHVIKASSGWKGGGSDSGDNATTTTGDTTYEGGNSAGGTDGHDNCQPYIVGVFIQKIAENY
jgi:microcystin-dependent protein